MKIPTTANKKSNALEETFGTLKFTKPTEQILKESDEENWDEYEK